MTPNNQLRFLGRVCCALAGLFLFTNVASAQGTGSISGRVLNATNGQYVKNARVTVEGTTLEAVTGEFGEYRISGVPAGAASVRATYGNLPESTQSVAVSSGSNAEQNFSLGTGAVREGDIVKLNEFVVTETRATNAAEIATSEQRYAANIKNVVTADAFGDVNEGNVGEFLKYLPGLTVDYVAADVRTISVGGFASNFTGVNVDGNRMASANSGNTDRVFELEQVSINNMSRAEVTRVPTADQPMDTLGGSVNMISKNAFEQSRRNLVYKFNVNFSNESRDEDPWKRSPGPGSKKTFKNLPGFELTFTNPVSDRFGYVLTAISSNQFNEQHRSASTWNFNAAGTGATPTTPFLSNWAIQDGPKNSYRDSLSGRFDWRTANNHVFSAGVQFSYYKAFFANRNLNFATGTNAVSTPAGGIPLSFGETFTQGAAGRGTVTQGMSARDKLGATQALNLTYRYLGRSWELNAGASASNGRTWYRDQARGHFESVTTTMQSVNNVRFDGVGYPKPATFTVKDAAGNLLDPNALKNYRINTVVSRPTDGEATNKAFYVDALQRFYLRGTALSFKTGYSVRSEDRDNRRYNEIMTFLGADGTANTADDIATVAVEPSYVSVDPYWGYPPIEWTSTKVAYDLYKANPTWFASTTAQAVTNETFRITNSEKYSEVITATYLQSEISTFKNKLRILAGWRYEKTHDKGLGPLVDPDAPFQRNPDGTFVLVSGARVRKPEAGTAGSMEELRLVRKERQGRGNRNYDGIYPSVNSTFKFTDSFQMRFAFAKTFGRPNFTDLVPATTIDEADSPPAPGSPPGIITYRNPALKPWSGQNYDLGLEYYFKKGGYVTVYGSQKTLTNFWNTVSTPLTAALANELGVDPSYVGWTLNSKLNGGGAKITGIAADYNQPLDFIPRVGKFFYLRANITRLHLEGEKAADFTNFIPRAGNVGITFNRRPLNIKLTYNYRGEQKLSTQAAINGFQYYAARNYVDMTFEYTLSSRATLFLNGRNITNEPQDRVNVGNNIGYSQLNQVEEFGIQWGLGIKGKF